LYFFWFLFIRPTKITLDESRRDGHVTFELKQTAEVVTRDKQKVYLFKTLELQDFAELIEAYSPRHATWLAAGRIIIDWKHKKVLY